MSIVCAAFSTSEDDVAHAGSAVGDGRRGWKSSSAFHLLAGADQLDRLAVTARIDSAAPPRPSPSTRVSTIAGQADALVERARQVDRVLGR